MSEFVLFYDMHSDGHPKTDFGRLDFHTNGDNLVINIYE